MNRGTITVVDYTALVGATATVTVNGTATVLTGVAGAPGANQFQAATSNDATSTSLAAAVNAVSGAQAGTAGPVVNVSVAAPGGTLTLASSDGVNLPVATTGLSITANIYKADLWDNDGKPFAIRSLKCELNPKTPAASVQVRLIKINRSGSYTTVLDSSTKTLLQGNSATAVNNEACAIYLDATGAGSSLNTSLDQLPDAACVFPRDQEGIAVLVSGVYDADEIRCSLQYYDLYM